METELKMRFAREDDRLDFWQQVWVQNLILPDSAQETSMYSRYFDTEDRFLTTNLASLRIRQENDRTVATLKVSQSSNRGLGLHQRQEWAIEKDEEGDDNDWFDHPARGLDASWFLRLAVSDGDPDDQLRTMLQAIDGQQLEEICQADFSRLAYDIGYGDSLMELAMDQGDLRAGGLTEPVAELELELKEGDVRDLIELGEELRGRFGLIPEPRSKYARCLDLLKQSQTPDGDGR
jgi:triphosphatase